jgi:hypothetical protein
MERIIPRSCTEDMIPLFCSNVILRKNAKIVRAKRVD